MIHFDPVPEPPDFDSQARQPGKTWLAANPPPKRPKNYWKFFKGALADGFHNLCAYSAMYEPVGTVDHFVSCYEDRSKAYDWENYRYCAGWINSSKGNTLADKMLDPFVVETGWFEINLPSLQLRVADTIPLKVRERAEFVLKRLHLRDDERVLRQREAWYALYQEEKLTLAGLEKMAPLIAAAVRARQPGSQ
ncbi:MAG: hypothetical protein OXC68_11920 [Aestuariivita sp.]|nr:hypothetical protein [Aestuariivita sp.]